ncbi:MAG: SpoIIE family protein phosphatase [Akkermansiaceae bacterium]
MRPAGWWLRLARQPTSILRIGAPRRRWFLLFTDGSVEAENLDGGPFGLIRLANSLDQALDGPMAAISAEIVCDVTFFKKHEQYEDDVCLVVIEACGGDTPDSW